MSQSINYQASGKPGQPAQPESRPSMIGRRWSDGLNGAAPQENRVIRQGPFKLDDRGKRFYVSGRVKNLPPKLFNLMRILMSNPEKVFSQAELAVYLWPESERADPDDVKQYVYLLRRAIEPDPANPRWLQNVRGFGYQLVVF